MRKLSGMTAVRLNWFGRAPAKPLEDAPPPNGRDWTIRGDVVACQIHLRSPDGKVRVVSLDGMSECAPWVWDEMALRIERALNDLSKDHA